MNNTAITANFIKSTTGKTTITSATPSTSTNTGSLTVVGGFGVAGNVNVGGDVSAGGDVSISGNVTTNGKNIDIGLGKLLLHGGGEISDKNGELTIASDNFVDVVGGTLRVYSGTKPTNSIFNGTIETGNIKCTSSTPSSSNTTGALTVTGGVGVGGNMNIGGNVNISGKMMISEPGTTPGSATDGTLIIKHGNTGGSSSIIFTSALNAGSDYAYIRYSDNLFGGGTDEKSLLTIGVENDGHIVNPNHVDNIKIAPSGSLEITGNTNITNTLQSNTTNTGALAVLGGVGIAKKLNVGEEVKISSTTSSDDKNSGALVVGGGVGIGGTLNVGGKMVITDPGSSIADSHANSTILINHTTSGGSSSIVFASNINNTDLSDYGYIRYDDKQGSGTQNSLLTIGTKNDSDDDIKIAPSGSLEIAGNTTITKDTQSNATNAGALIVSGGVGIAKKLNVGEEVKISSTINSTSTVTGALVVDGGVGINGNVNAGQALITGATSVTGVTKITSSALSDDKNSGALVVTGGVGIGGTLNIGGKMVISESGSTPASASNGTILLKHARNGISSIVFASTIDSGSDCGFIEYSENVTDEGQNSLLTIGTTNDSDDNIKIAPSGSLEIDGNTKITKDTQSNATNAGALIVSGGVGIAKKLNVGQEVKITSTTSSNSTTSGALVVSGGVGIAENLYVGGSIISSSITGGTPTGSIMAYLGLVDPNGWIIANGNERTPINSSYLNLINMRIGSAISISPATTTTPVSTYAIKINFKTPFGGQTSILNIGKIIFYDMDGNSINNINVLNIKSTTGGTNTTKNPSYKYTNESPVTTTSTFLANDLKPLYNNTVTKYGVGFSSITGDGIDLFLNFGQLYCFSKIEFFTGGSVSSSTNTYVPSKITIVYSTSPDPTTAINTYNNNSGWVSYLSESTITNNSNMFVSMYDTPALITGYAPPDYRGAFLRGTGASSVNGGYAGPAIAASQNHATQTHNHDITDPGHGHIHGVKVNGLNCGAARTTIVTKSEFCIGENNYDALIRIQNNTTAITINDSSNVGIRYTHDNETRPFNFGVNWIIKL